MTKKNKKRYYAGPIGLALGDIYRRSVGLDEKEIFHGRQVIYTHKGRSGLALLCQHWNLQAGHEILMPAYNCGTEVDPFVSDGLNVVFYRVTVKARLDLEDLLHRVTSRTRLIYVTHYFGWPQDLRFLFDYCREKNIHLVEDCALSLFSSPASAPIGLLGDAALYSFPKTLPVPDGGALTLPKGALSVDPPREAPSSKVMFRELLPLIKRTMLRFLDSVGFYQWVPGGLLQRKPREGIAPKTPAGLPEMPRSYYFDKAIKDMTASRLTFLVLKHAVPKFIVTQRRKNYLQLFNAAKTSRVLRPLFYALPDGVCPLSLPVIVEGDRESACQHFNTWGIAATQWWAGYHRCFDWEAFPEAKFLKDQVLTIPVHQQLSPSAVEHIRSAIFSLGN